MDDRARDFQLAAHVDAISTRTHADGARLADRLVGHSWPGGPADRSERGALGWLRRWRPGRPPVMPPHCACVSGRCLVCN